VISIGSNNFLELKEIASKFNIQEETIYPVTEREILIETINILRDKKRISIRALREYLKENMNLSEEDLIINKNRNDTRFDQKVRNLVSHRDGNGLLNYCNYENGYLILKED